MMRFLFIAVISLLAIGFSLEGMSGLRWANAVINKMALALVGLVAVPLGLWLGKDGKFPSWLWYWDNDDSGWDGDYNWRVKFPNEGYKSFWNRFRWLAIRNSLHNGSEKLFGIPRGNDLEVKREGNEPSDWGGVAGYRRMTAEYEGREYWQRYWVIKWSDARCANIKLGWKLERLPEKGASVVLNPQPWRPFGTQDSR